MEGECDRCHMSQLASLGSSLPLATLPSAYFPCGSTPSQRFGCTWFAGLSLCLCLSVPPFPLFSFLSLVNTVNLAFPLFGVVYLWSQWLFLLAFLISIGTHPLHTQTPSYSYFSFKQAKIFKQSLSSEGS